MHLILAYCCSITP